jgi:signal peptidase
MIIYRIFVYPKLLSYAESITTSFSIILLTISILFLGFRKTINNKINTKAIKTVISFLIFYFLLTYGLGLSTGFLKNSYSLNLVAIFENIFNIAIMIFAIELFRYIFISTNKDKKTMTVLITILLILFEINIAVRYDSFESIEKIFRFVALTILPITMKNVLCSYLTYQTNYKASLMYRLVMELHVYIVPIAPDLGDWATSIFELILPFVILMDYSRNVYNYNKSAEHTFNKNNLKKSDIPFVIATIAIGMLVFGIGPYKMIGIETGSMTPALNVGDAVIISKNYDVEKIEEKDIIAYENENGVLVIHRVIKENTDGTYITKGDYNNVADTLYVKKEQIKGKVVIRIPYIAYPAKWLK